MIQKSIKLSEFSGINNVSKPEQLSNTELSAAFNLDLTNAKSLRRRQGRRSLYQGSCHSLFSDGDYLYFRDNTSLIRYNTADDSYSTLRSSLLGDNKMQYLSVAGRLYYSDGIVNGVIDGGSDRSWGLDAPTQPAVTNSVGDLPAGTYLVAITYIRSDGQESGSCQPVMIRSTTGGLIITDIPQSSDSDVSYIVVYLSPRNSSTLYRFAVLSSGTTTLTVRGGDIGNGVPLQTMNVNAPPVGNLLESYNGRIYIMAGDVLWYTNSYQYEHVDYRFNYIQFDGRGTMLRAVDNGLWVSAGGLAHFLGGDDPQSEQAPISVKYSYSYPAIEGTACVADAKMLGSGDVPGNVAIWASKKGVCVGAGDGSLLATTEKRFKPPDVSQGVATMAEYADYNQYLFGLNCGPNGGAVRLPLFRT